MISFRFYITRGIVVTEVFPLGDWKFTFEKGKNQVFFTQKLSGKLSFSNRQSITDYTFFKAIEDSGNCEVLQLLVTKKCSGTDIEINYFRGTFGTVDGDWDLDKCIFEVEPLVIGSYPCLLSDIQQNFLELPNIVEVWYNPSGAGNDRKYKRGRLFSEVIDFVATETCPEIKSVISDFFQINPENVSIYNYVTGELNTYTQLICSQITDVRDPIPSNAATQALISFKKLTDDLRKLFNVFWFVDADDNIRLEHLTYFIGGAVGLDLTQQRYADYINGTNKYSYNRQDSPRYETWTLPETEVQMGAQLIYDNACGNSKLNENEIKYEISTLYTDWQTARFYPTTITSLTKIFLFATKFNAGNTYLMLGGNGQQNEELVLGKLVLRFHRWGRPQLNCTLIYYGTTKNNTADRWDDTEKNFGDFLIYNTSKTKEQTEIIIPLCCDEEFDPTKQIKTQIGTGELLSAEYSPLIEETLKLKVAHSVDDITELQPDEINGLQGWWAPDSIVQSGGFVTDWLDKTTNGYDFTQAIAMKQPAFITVSGFDGLRFDGIDDGMQTISFASFPNKRGTCFVICKPDFPSSASVIIGTFTNGGIMWDIGLNPIFSKLVFYSNSEAIEWYMSDQVGEVDTYSYASYFLFCLMRTDDTQYFAWMNGRRHEERNSSNPMLTAGQATPNILNLGNGFSAGNSHMFNGDIHEILLYDRQLTDIERQHVEQYLFKKYKGLRSYMAI